MFSIIILYAICATTFTLSKAALAYSAPFFYVAVRMLIAGTLLLGYSFFTRIKKAYSSHISSSHTLSSNGISPEPLTTRTLFIFAQIVLFHISIPYLAEMWALTHITSTESSLIYNLSPFITAVLAYLWFSERLSKRQIIGLFIGISSTIPLIWQNYACSGNTLISGNIAALLAVLVAVISSAYAWILIKDLLQHQYSISYINGIAMLGGGIIAFIVSILSHEWAHGAPVSAWIPFITLTLAIIVVANIIFYNWYGILLKKYSPTLLAFAGILTPIFTNIFGTLFLGECFIWMNVVALACLGIGMTLFITKK
jgi:drug/metabolite transporter (DMT)-like permease